MKKFTVEARAIQGSKANERAYDHSSELFDIVGDYTEAETPEEAKELVIEWVCDQSNQNPQLEGCATEYDSERDEIITKNEDGGITFINYDIEVKETED